MLRENIVRILDTAEKSGEIQGVTVLKILSAVRGQDKPPLLSDEKLRGELGVVYDHLTADKLWDARTGAKAQREADIKHYEKV